MWEAVLVEVSPQADSAAAARTASTDRSRRGRTRQTIGAPTRAEKTGHRSSRRPGLDARQPRRRGKSSRRAGIGKQAAADRATFPQHELPAVSTQPVECRAAAPFDRAGAAFPRGGQTSPLSPTRVWSLRCRSRCSRGRRGSQIPGAIRFDAPARSWRDERARRRGHAHVLPTFATC